LLTARCVVCAFARCVRVQAWATGMNGGVNGNGMLGLGDTIQRSTPEQLLSPTNIVQVAGGSDHTVMIAHA
jgi:alpha-tubulin suppressor-like RCC1 family protein